MPQWRTETLALSSFPLYAPPALLSVEANGGRVELQRLGSDGVSWSVIETFDTDTTERIAVAGSQNWRIEPIGGAAFLWASF